MRRRPKTTRIIKKGFVVRKNNTINRITVLRKRFLPSTNNRPFGRNSLPRHSFPILIHTKRIYSRTFQVRTIRFSRTKGRFFGLIQRRSTTTRSHVRKGISKRHLSMRPHRKVMVLYLLRNKGRKTPTIRRSFLPFLQRHKTRSMETNTTTHLTSTPNFPRVNRPRRDSTFQVRHTTGLFRPITMNTYLRSKRMVFPFNHLLSSVRIVTSNPGISFNPNTKETNY